MALKEKVTEILGKQYSPKISTYLVEKNIINSYGVPYSYESIQQVVNGVRFNEEMIVAITELLDIENKKKKSLQKKLSKIKL